MHFITVYLVLLVGTGQDNEGNEINLNYIIGKIFIPIAYIMGVPSQDVNKASFYVKEIKQIQNKFNVFS